MFVCFTCIFEIMQPPWSQLLSVLRRLFCCYSLFTVAPFVCVCVCVFGPCFVKIITVLGDLSSFAIVLLRKRELVDNCVLGAMWMSVFSRKISAQFKNPASDVCKA